MNEKAPLKKYIVISFIIIAVLFITFAAFSYFRSYQTLTIKFNRNVSGSTISVYKKIDGSKNNLVTQVVAPSEPLRLKKGDYAVVFSGQEYADKEVSVKLSDSPENITIEPSYTTEKLAKILTTEKDSIHNAIKNKYPQTRNEYTIDQGKLYELGTWYGTKIHIKQTAEQERENYVDTYRIVLKKSGGNWEVVTVPPEIVLSSKKYPSIPKDILIDINKNPEKDN
jgi:hypothetical protein